MTWNEYDMEDLFPGWFEPGVEMCEGGCGWPRSFCNCAAPWPFGNE